jgi:hypothetical protein
MKHNYSVFLLLMLIAGMLFMAGCMSSTSAPNATPVATPTPQVVNVTATATPTVTIPTTTQIIPTPTSAYSADEIDNHFMDIAFNSKFQTLGELSASGDQVAITGSYTDNDVSTLTNFLLQCNNNSPGMQLPTVPILRGGSGDITFNFMSQSSLEDLAQAQPTVGQVNRDSSGEIVSIYKSVANPRGNATYSYIYRYGTVFFNNNLTGDERTHYMIRGLLYYLGFVGQTTTYPDSIFYAGQNNIITPNGIDWQAINVMYEGKVTPGMTYNNVLNVIHGS